MRGAIYSRVSTEIQDYGKQTDELKDYAARFFVKFGGTSSIVNK